MRVATVLVTNAHVRCPLSPREHIRAHVPSRALSLSPARQGGRVAGSAAEGLPAPLSFEPWTLEDVLSGGSVTGPCHREARWAPPRLRVLHTSVKKSTGPHVGTRGPVGRDRT